MLRRHVFYNNAYQLGRLRRVKNIKVKESLQEKGINVIGTQDLFREFPFLPAVPAWNYDHTQDEPVKSPLAADEDHPLFKERPVWSMTQRSKYPRNMEIVCAMVSKLKPPI